MNQIDDDPTKSGSDEIPSADGKYHILLGEERAVVGKVEVERVAARIGLRTHIEEVPVSELLRTESVKIERVAVDRIVAEPPATRVEDGVTIIPVVEEVLVRQFRIVEEIRLVRITDTSEHNETVALRRQEVVIDETSGDAIPAATRTNDANA